MARRSTFYLPFFLIAFLLSAYAQTRDSGMQGSVKDTRGVAVPWAIVEIGGRGVPGGRVVHPNKDGNFTSGNLPAGEYSISVGAQGYRIVKKRVRLRAGKLSVVDVILKVDPYQHRKPVAEHTNCILCHPPSTPQNPKVKMD
jgi:hypothetical protein